MTLTPMQISSAKKNFVVGQILKTDGVYVNQGDVILVGAHYLNTNEMNEIESEIKKLNNIAEEIRLNQCDESCFSNFKILFEKSFNIQEENELKKIIRIIKKEVQILSFQNINFKEIENYILNVKNAVSDFNESEVYTATKSGNIRITKEINIKI